MQILNVPTATVSEVKNSPGRIFDRAARENNGVYVFNRGIVAGVMLTKLQYESLNTCIEELTERLFDMEAAHRILIDNEKTFTDAEVRGAVVAGNVEIDMNDGWE